VKDKHNLRFQLRKSRKEFEKDHLFWSDSVSFLPLPLRLAIDEARVVAGYVKTGSEVDSSHLLDVAAAAGKPIALPWLADRGAMLVFREWVPGQALETAPFGFQQPSAEAPLCTPDLILTPLVGFDRALNRLGQGAGHYDRIFAEMPSSLRVGLAWSIQECENLPVEPWDVPLDAILTETEWITGPRSRIGAL
jgi:5-formyltetrahydrofolate cyclo-ligase